MTTMKKTIYILIVMALFSIVLTGCYKKTELNPNPDEILKGEIEGNPNFIMSDNLSCTILASSDAKQIDRIISLINLNTNEPKVLFEEGGTSPFKKVYETDDRLVIQLIATGTGGVDTIFVNKENGVFARSSVGSILGTYAIAQKGNCK